jgi:hypothetical protein
MRKQWLWEQLGATALGPAKTPAMSSTSVQMLTWKLQDNIEVQKIMQYFEYFNTSYIMVPKIHIKDVWWLLCWAKQQVHQCLMSHPLVKEKNESSDEESTQSSYGS